MKTGEEKKQGKGATLCPDHEQIAARAYKIYLERDRQPGHEMDDWLQAEYELMQLPVDRLAKVKTKVPPRGAHHARRSIVEVVRSALL